MKKLALLLFVAACAPAWADAPGHTIDDSRGEIGERDPVVDDLYITLPEVDLWWVDIVPRDDALEVSWRVANLSHRTFVPSSEGLNFLCLWGIQRADGSPGGSNHVVAERVTFDGLRFETRFEYVNASARIQVPGEFDWAESTVRIKVPIGVFEEGDTLVQPVAWSTATTQNVALVHLGTHQFGDRAPDEGYGSDVQIP